MSFLNTPSVIFEILPFIFLLSTQVFFIHLIDKNELQFFKYTGLNNIKIMKILGIYTHLFLVLFWLFFFTTDSSILKNSYLLIKNSYSDDNKYLAVITENGLWIKDEINKNINIINANKVEQ